MDKKGEPSVERAIEWAASGLPQARPAETGTSMSLVGQKTISVALVEDNDFQRAQHERWLTTDSRFQCAGSYADGESALPEILAKKPDLALIDSGLPELKGKELVWRLKSARAQVTEKQFTERSRWTARANWRGNFFGCSEGDLAKQRGPWGAPLAGKKPGYPNEDTLTWVLDRFGNSVILTPGNWVLFKTDRNKINAWKGKPMSGKKRLWMPVSVVVPGLLLLEQSLACTLLWPTSGAMGSGYSSSCTQFDGGWQTSAEYSGPKVVLRHVSAGQFCSDMSTTTYDDGVEETSHYVEAYMWYDPTWYQGESQISKDDKNWADANVAGKP